MSALRDHLRLAQEQMKAYANRKRRHIEYCVGDYVFLKICTYRQLTLRKKRNEKLYPKLDLFMAEGRVSYRVSREVEEVPRRGRVTD